MLTESVWKLFFSSLKLKSAQSTPVMLLIFCFHTILFNQWMLALSSWQIRPNESVLSTFLNVVIPSVIIFLSLTSSWLLNSIKETLKKKRKTLQSCALCGNLLQANLPYLLQKYTAEHPISSCLLLVYNCIHSLSCFQP